ncbi:hypothetical protein C1637_15980 [Chryseobacterium lactis]|uniref:Uncharacterized protein n=1 Tax=Chryseobacterium lactis TaxID=1241981 RepID=A0A3G6RN18_CHRLC|nr:hypothetical protein [Chryseobacterium lactis]AZA83991.1 hypothetical protein EG342_19820 [Chryseobacterium lactis]AZB04377.1 hypothetical protein EG341_10695 [Chryseobacterium lactis]PNW12546.1 hypothetical protein C1637_15980 [Chryseobacterium lactis]
MKFFYFTLFISLLSCSKSVEDKCFVEKMNNTDVIFVDDLKEKPYTVKQILDQKPKYLDIINLKKFRTFKKDSADSHFYTSSDSENMIRKQYVEFKEFKSKFSDQFVFYAKEQVGNVQYGLGKNNLGYWLLKIENNKADAYFLGLSFSHYYINKIQENPFIENGFLQLQGSLVKIIKVAGLPGYDDYSAMEDGKLFKIKINDLTKDSDNDGYNDIFENSFGLNPNNKDTDGDGVNDFEDMNPMFKSGKNKFTELYELLLPNYGTTDMKKMYYVFQVYESDCDYFHQIRPDVRVLFIPENKDKQTYYTKITDITDEYISKIKKDKEDPNRFYIQKFGNSYGNNYSADYEKGKWILKLGGGYII